MQKQKVKNSQNEIRVEADLGLRYLVIGALAIGLIVALYGIYTSTETITGEDVFVWSLCLSPLVIMLGVFLNLVWVLRKNSVVVQGNTIEIGGQAYTWDDFSDVEVLPYKLSLFWLLIRPMRYFANIGREHYKITIKSNDKTILQMKSMDFEYRDVVAFVGYLQRNGYTTHPADVINDEDALLKNVAYKS